MEITVVVATAAKPLVKASYWKQLINHLVIEHTSSVLHERSAIDDLASVHYISFCANPLLQVCVLLSDQMQLSAPWFRASWHCLCAKKKFFLVTKTDSRFHYSSRSSFSWNASCNLHISKIKESIWAPFILDVLRTLHMKVQKSAISVTSAALYFQPMAWMFLIHTAKNDISVVLITVKKWAKVKGESFLKWVWMTSGLV